MSEKKELAGPEVAGGSARALEGAEGDRKRSGRVESVADPELVEKPRRRTFSATYKLAIVREADACSKSGEIGALLRREGLYTSHLSTWRKQRDIGALDALSKRRGRRGRDPRDVEMDRLRRRAERAEAELATARKVIEVQGNVSALLGDLLKPRGATSDESSEP